MKSNIFLESDFLSAKRIVISIINRPQSEPTVHYLKELNSIYDDIIATGIDDVYCVSFGDFVLFDFLMPKLSKKIKFVQLSDVDNLLAFQQLLNKKKPVKFLLDYWQATFVLDCGNVSYYMEQPFVKKKILNDTREKIYSEISPKKLLESLTNKPI